MRALPRFQGEMTLKAKRGAHKALCFLEGRWRRLQRAGWLEREAGGGLRTAVRCNGAAVDSVVCCRSINKSERLVRTLQWFYGEITVKTKQGAHKALFYLIALAGIDSRCGCRLSRATALRPEAAQGRAGQLTGPVQTPPACACRAQSPASSSRARIWIARWRSPASGRWPPPGGWRAAGFAAAPATARGCGRAFR